MFYEYWNVGIACRLGFSTEIHGNLQDFFGSIRWFFGVNRKMLGWLLILGIQWFGLFGRI